MKKLLALLLTLTMVLALAACGGGDDAAADDAAADEGGDEAAVVYAVEAGSAGEEAAKANGFEMNSVQTQADALMEVQSGTSGAAIIDSLMAGAMVGEGTSYPDLKITDQRLTEEYYGVGCRQASDLAAVVNEVFAEAAADGTMDELATTYGVQSAVLDQAEAPALLEQLYADNEVEPVEAVAGDVDYIKEKGTLVVGMTEFAPMDYRDEEGNWIGFDADLAKLVAEKLGVEIEFLVIDWDRQLEELDSKNVDILWNGMTLTNARLSSMNCTVPYCNNAQVVITK